MKMLIDRYYFGVMGWTYSETMEQSDKNLELYFQDMLDEDCYQDLLFVRNVDDQPNPPQYLIGQGER